MCGDLGYSMVNAYSTPRTNLTGNACLGVTSVERVQLSNVVGKEVSLARLHPSSQRTDSDPLLIRGHNCDSQN